MAETEVYPRVQDLLDVMADAQTFNQLLRRSGAIAELDDVGSITVFAPTQAAFEKLPPATLGELVRFEDSLRQVIEYHFVPGKLSIEEVRASDSLPTLYGSKVTIFTSDHDTFYGSAHVDTADIETGNGFVHLIDTVVFPEIDI